MFASEEKVLRRDVWNVCTRVRGHECYQSTKSEAAASSPLRFDATRTTALVMDRISKHSRLLASIRGFRSNSRKSFIFEVFLDISYVVLQMAKNALAVAHLLTQEKCVVGRE
jgi:hypothetical protein